MGNSHIDYEWFDNRRQILLLHFQNGWDWNELNTILNKVEVMLDEIEHPVTIIFDVKNMSQFPLNIFQQGKSIFQRTRHPQLKQLIVAGANVFITAVFRAFESMLPASWIDKWDILFIDSLEQALEHASQYPTNRC